MENGENNQQELNNVSQFETKEKKGINLFVVIIIALVLCVLCFLGGMYFKGKVTPNNEKDKEKQKEVITEEDPEEFEEEVHDEVFNIDVSQNMSELMDTLPSMGEMNTTKTATNMINKEVSLDGKTINVNIEEKVVCTYDYLEDGETLAECSCAGDCWETTLKVADTSIDTSDGSYVKKVQKLDDKLLSVEIASKEEGTGQIIIKFIDNSGNIVKSFIAVSNPYDDVEEPYVYENDNIVYYCNSKNKVYKKTLPYSNGVFGKETKTQTKYNIDGVGTTKGC